MSVFSTCLSAVAAASIATVVVGDWTIPRGTASSTIPINVTGGDAVDGIVFIAEISQGGILQAAPGPSFVSIDMTTGTIFESNQFPPAVHFSMRNSDTTLTNVAATGGPPVYTPTLGPAIKTKGTFVTLIGTVNASGLLGTLVISTVGATPGVYDLRMVGTVTGSGGRNSAFSGPLSDPITIIQPAIFTNGTITVTAVPEPTTLELGLLAAVGLGAVAIRKRRAHRTA